MYIMIHESGDMVLLKGITSDDFHAADDGYVNLLDISVADKPLRYFNEKWVGIPEVMQLRRN